MTAQVRLFNPPKSLAETLAADPASYSLSSRSLPDPVESQTPKSAPPLEKNTERRLSVYSRVPMDNQKPAQGGVTFAHQDKLPKLPIPDLEPTCKKYLQALKPLQSAREHAETQHAVNEFLKQDGPDLQERLKRYAQSKTSYIEQFCMLAHQQVLSKSLYVI
jgi:carnitine O-acetyltransferase